MYRWAFVLLEDLAFCCLWVPEVHHFVEQFVDDDEVIPDTLLLQDLEVFREDLDDLVEEKENFGGIGVLFRQGEDVEVAVTDVEVLLESSRQSMLFAMFVFVFISNRHGGLCRVGPW